MPILATSRSTHDASQLHDQLKLLAMFCWSVTIDLFYCITQAVYVAPWLICRGDTCSWCLTHTHTPCSLLSWAFPQHLVPSIGCWVLPALWTWCYCNLCWWDRLPGFPPDIHLLGWLPWKVCGHIIVFPCLSDTLNTQSPDRNHLWHGAMPMPMVHNQERRFRCSWHYQWCWISSNKSKMRQQQVPSDCAKSAQQYLSRWLCNQQWAWCWAAP